jgi:hypothetical protein
MIQEDNTEVAMTKATLKIEASTRDRLKKLGSMEDTFDTVICRLIDEHDAIEASKKKK